MSRPDPPENRHPGFHWEARECDPRWQLDDTGGIKPCRMANCRTRKPVVAKLDRKRKGRVSWWYYCEDHLYGRWVEGGKVMKWTLVEDKTQ